MRTWQIAKLCDGEMSWTFFPFVLGSPTINGRSQWRLREISNPKTESNHDLAVAGTGVSELSHASEDAIELYERFIREEETNPSTGVYAKMVHEDDLAVEVGLPPPLRRSPKVTMLSSWQAQPVRS